MDKFFHMGFRDHSTSANSCIEQMFKKNRGEKATSQLAQLALYTHGLEVQFHSTKLIYMYIYIHISIVIGVCIYIYIYILYIYI